MARRTVYCVQAYDAGKVSRAYGPVRQFGTAAAALRVAQALSDKRPGAVAFSVSGEPDFDTWEEPVVIATFGRTPTPCA